MNFSLALAAARGASGSRTPEGLAPEGAGQQKIHGSRHFSVGLSFSKKWAAQSPPLLRVPPPRSRL